MLLQLGGCCCCLPVSVVVVVVVVRRLLFLSTDQFLSDSIDVGEAVPFSLTLNYLFSRAPPDMKSPYQVTLSLTCTPHLPGNPLTPVNHTQKVTILVVRSNSANAWRASKYMSIGKDDL